MTSIRLAHKLTLISLIPLIGLFIYASANISTNYQSVNAFSQEYQLANLIQASNSVVHEVQIERGMTAGFLSSKGSKFGLQLIKQRAKVDSSTVIFARSIAELSSENLKQQLHNPAEEILHHIETLAATRQTIDQMQFSAAESVNYYTRLNSKLIALPGIITKVTHNVTMANMAQAYYALVQLKEHAGLERALLASAFSGNQFNQQSFQRFIELANTQHEYQKLFLSLANNAANDFYQQTLKGESVERSEEIRKIALNKGSGNNLDINAEEWFSVQTAKIDLQKKVEDYLVSSIGSYALNMKEKAMKSLLVNCGIVVIVIFINIAFAIIVQRSILAQLGTDPDDLCQVASRIAEGHLDNTFTKEGRKIVGVYHAMKVMQDKLSEVTLKLQQTSEQIAITSEQVSTTAYSLKNYASEQAENIQATGVAMDEITALIVQNSKNSLSAREDAKDSAILVKAGNEAVEQTILVMEQITHQIKIIEDFAYQTNLLALNASIEAAREIGSGGNNGFSIIATEVRKLAERSKIAAEEIDSLAKTSTSVIESTREALNKMLPNVTKTAEHINQIAHASSEQSSGAEEISRAIARIDKITQQHTHTSEELAASAEELSIQANELKKMTVYFRS